MSGNIDAPEITLEASASLSAYQFHIVTLDTSGNVKLADDPDDPVEAMVGVLQNKPDAALKEAVVRVAGVAKVMGGATVAPGIWVTCDGSGHLAAAVANDNVLGITLEAAASGKVSKVLLKPGAGYTAPV